MPQFTMRQSRSRAAMSLCDQAHRPAQHVIRGRDRDSGAPHADRLAASSRLDARTTGDSRRRLRELPRRYPRRRGEDKRHRSWRAGSRGRGRATHKRRPGTEPNACRPQPATPRPRHLGAKSRESPASGPGPSPTGHHALTLESASQFRPDGPSALTSEEYTDDFDQVKDLGRIDSTTRTPEQTIQALFWTDHDLRVWNDGISPSLSRTGSTRCRQHGCWQWSMCPGATR